VKLRSTTPSLQLSACVALAALLAAALLSAAQAADSYVGRPIYSDPSNGLQLPPSCNIEPTWRSRIGGTEMEVWVLTCDSTARVWLLARQIVEMLNAREARLRFQVVDERVLAGETAGDSLSVQCTGASDAAGFVVYGARGALRVDVAHRRLTDADVTGVDCVRFPDREAMMRKLQQPERSNR
jgi:hypothetical protein